MADPVSWMMIASTAVNATAQLAQGVSTYQQERYAAEIAGQNAKTAAENAARARLEAAASEESQRRASRQELGRAAAATSQSGAAGSGPGQGSYGAINKQSATNAELDALNIRYGGEQQAFGDLTEAAQFRMERKAAIQRAKGGLITGVLGSASAALSGAADYRAAQGRYGRASQANPIRPPSAPRVTSRRHYSQLPRGVAYVGRY